MKAEPVNEKRLKEIDVQVTEYLKEEDEPDPGINWWCQAVLDLVAEIKRLKDVPPWEKR